MISARPAIALAVVLGVAVAALTGRGESDGSIEPLDALKVCATGMTQMGLNVLTHSLDDTQLGRPLLHTLVNDGLPLPDGCQKCPERTVCGGGYYPNRFSKVRGFNNPSVWCADILKLIAHVRAVLPIRSPVAKSVSAPEIRGFRADAALCQEDVTPYVPGLTPQ